MPELNASMSLFHRACSALIACSAMLLAGCATPDRVVEARAGNLRTTLQQLADQHAICAAAVAVVRNRRIEAIETASGCVSMPAVEPSSIFQAASLSKPVFAYAVLRLVRQGKLDLDTPIVRYLPKNYVHRRQPSDARLGAQANSAADPRFGLLTARMLLSHAGGLPNWADGPLGFTMQPGTAWQYSGEGYLLLQRVVESITGQALDVFMRNEFFTSLAMPDSDFLWQERFAPRLMPRIGIDGDAVPSYRFPMPNAAASLHTSAADYATFVVALLNDGEALKQIIARPVAVDPTLHLAWGAGWGIEHKPDDTLIFQ